MTTTVRRSSRRKPTDEQIAERAAKVEALTGSCTPRSST